MKNTLHKAAAILLMVGILFPSFSHLSANTAPTQTFNPNYIISDEEMQNNKSMTRTDIQAFLDSKGGFIATYRASDEEGVERSAADLIYRAANKYQINPKYLLVKLQKEMSLVTHKNPTERQLDYATGYGVCDSCSFDDPKVTKFKGFGLQVDNAAGIIRWYYDNVNQQSWIKRPGQSYMISNIDVVPTNYATAFLYTYTPHLQGNRNFWLIWQQWFEQVYPDGTLLKSQNGATVYLIEGGKKRPFGSMSALVTRFDPKLILTVPESELSRYETGREVSLPNYSILKADNGVYYLLDYDTMRPFENADTVRALGYNPGEIVDITSSDIADYPIGTPITVDQKNPLGQLVRVTENKKLYYLKDQTYHPILDEVVAKVTLPHLEIESVSGSALSTYESGLPVLLKNGTLFGITGDNKIFAVEDGKKRHIASEEVFNSLGYNWKNIVWVNKSAGDFHPTGQPIFIRATPSPTSDTSAPTQATPIPTATAPKPSPTLEELMIRTAADKMSFIGPTYTTDVDAYLVADYDTGSILAGKNIDTVRPIASLTKVMTGYRLFVEGINPAAATAYSAAKHNTPYKPVFRLAEGEQVLNRHLMYAMLLSSLNTPARMLADAASTDETAFIKRMTTQAKEWGLTNTSFVDAYGGGTKNVSTAREYLTLFRHATKDANMRELMGMKQYEYNEIKDTDGKPYHYDYHSNKIALEDNALFTVLASKTGYLHESGAGLAMLVERKSDGKKFVIITLGNVDYSNQFTMPRSFTEWAMKTF